MMHNIPEELRSPPPPKKMGGGGGEVGWLVIPSLGQNKSNSHWQCIITHSRTIYFPVFSFSQPYKSGFHSLGISHSVTKWLLSSVLRWCTGPIFKNLNTYKEAFLNSFAPEDEITTLSWDSNTSQKNAELKIYLQLGARKSLQIWTIWTV